MMRSILVSRFLRRPLALAMSATFAVAFPIPAGAQVPGPAAAGGTWSVYRDYTFARNSLQIELADMAKARDVAAYLEQNPAHSVGIDGINAGRVTNVRAALIDAGVPAHKIGIGSYVGREQRADVRVAVVVGN